MPAAAVIPAPTAYIKVVAVKKLVVGFLPQPCGPRFARVLVAASASLRRPRPRLVARRRRLGVYFEEIRVFTASASLNMLAWNNIKGPRVYFVGFWIWGNG